MEKIPQVLTPLVLNRMALFHKIGYLLITSLSNPNKTRFPYCIGLVNTIPRRVRNHAVVTNQFFMKRVPKLLENEQE